MNFVPAELVAEGIGLALRLSDGASLALPADRVQHFSAHRDKTVTLGVRPEHITRSAGDDTRAGVIRHQVTIDLIQPTGSRTYATFLLGGVETVAELKPHDVSTVNEQVALTIDMNRVVLIDPESETVL
jgi:multiple sugar transport system ATP-binding protein